MRKREKGRKAQWADDTVLPLTKPPTSVLPQRSAGCLKNLKEAYLPPVSGLQVRAPKTEELQSPPYCTD